MLLLQMLKQELNFVNVASANAPAPSPKR